MPKVKILSSVAGYDLSAADYDKKEKYLNSFEKNKIWLLLGYLSGKKILDAGTGTGRLAVEMSKNGAEVTALDVSSEMLKQLSRKSNKIKTMIGDAECLPFDKEIFDLVTAAFLIVHFKDPSRFFDEAYRVLKDGGRLLVTNINQKEPPEIKTKQGVIKIESFYHRPEKIREILQSLAFTIEKEIIVKEGENWINQIIVAKK
ncbi:MAG: hypothetical protein COU29_00460 [Candidatus Magasanikbacteria bacterium CG10_big_fil_rev_8_21_14_0_10_36_32]|uniref:Methyltransferase type 11 domain-containing protein n=1 Tax=Candidatus Magasanikbacteria bacterium CG10_big_fil_rev_8_21_14_0_10_36_32 TaxID=1974646 RepID=A0A2M6W7D7_9BACT|nr:MAG: hypothetical protein COU29_00460 [Candidatus Magasanikbacteria bacterium CG10_big_fil_rev_8_21_14_0_10_36_32]